MNGTLRCPLKKKILVYVLRDVCCEASSSSKGGRGSIYFGYFAGGFGKEGYTYGLAVLVRFLVTLTPSISSNS